MTLPPPPTYTACTCQMALIVPAMQTALSGGTCCAGLARMVLLDMCTPCPWQRRPVVQLAKSHRPALGSIWLSSAVVLTGTLAWPVAAAGTEHPTPPPAMVAIPGTSMCSHPRCGWVHLREFSSGGSRIQHRCPWRVPLCPLGLLLKRKPMKEVSMRFYFFSFLRNIVHMDAID